MLWAMQILRTSLGFLVVSDVSDSKESACHAGDPGSILGSGRSPGEGTQQRLWLWLRMLLFSC